MPARQDPNRDPCWSPPTVGSIPIPQVSTIMNLPLGQSYHKRGPTVNYLVALARATGGAIIFSLPIFMTSETWELGVSAQRLRLALLLTLLPPLLVGLSHICGFEKTYAWLDDIIDAAASITIAFFAAMIVLWLFGELNGNVPWDDMVGKIAIQIVPGSIGALLAQSELGMNQREREKQTAHHHQFLHMLAGALFLALSIAPTEEILMISSQITVGHALTLIALSLLIMHAFVYALEFRGSEPRVEGLRFGSLFFRYTIPGYVLSLLISVFLLWTFNRTTGLAPVPLIINTIVLGFPAAIGAAAARLIL